MEQIDLQSIKNILEAAILASAGPVTVDDLARLFDSEVDHDLLRRLLDDLRADWSGRGIELVSLAGGWRFQTRSDLQRYLDRMCSEKSPKYSRAVLETLAIIAYRQPVTRGDIEDIRGVAVSPGILKALEGRGWIDMVGHREVPGRPALYATTKSFLNDLGLRSLRELPALDDLGTLVVQASPPAAEAETYVSDQPSSIPHEVTEHAESILTLTHV
ncbi:MAG: SMC-Scp complex subunit ScpB [Betaproteobacteria bacterium]|nr:SMC-Scp complex subunit ScpB [Betaproteobacteria bacterium]